MSPYREGSELPPIAPVLRRVRVSRDVPIWLHILVVTICALGVGGLFDIAGEIHRFHGLMFAGGLVLLGMGIGALVTTGSLTYRTWSWEDTQPESEGQR